MDPKDSKYLIFDDECAGSGKNKLAQAVERLRYSISSNKYKNRIKPVDTESFDRKYNVSVCAIFKNEAPYLREWIEFHKIVGVDHFYMYNNNSDDGFRDVIDKYVKEGTVTLIEWPYDQKQMECYKDCIEKFSSETRWLGFIDLDEFVVPKSSDKIYDFLKPFEKNRGSVKIYWRIYGTSGLMDRDLSGLVSEDFTVCWTKYYYVGKCIYNTAFGFNPESKLTDQLHHVFWANQNGRDIPPVNIFDNVCIRDREIADTADFPIQINHYFTKSYREYLDKKAKGDVYFKINPHDEEYFYFHEMKCTSSDYSAYKYLIKLKKALEVE